MYTVTTHMYILQVFKNLHKGTSESSAKEWNHMHWSFKEHKCICMLTYVYRNSCVCTEKAVNMPCQRAGVQSVQWLWLLAHNPVSIFCRGMHTHLKSCEKQLLASSCLSIHLNGTIWLPLGIFSWNFILETNIKICLKNLSLVKIGQKYQALYMRPKYILHYWWRHM
jgi:hypothetical protein